MFISEISDVSQHLTSTTGTSALGTGGMLTKMQAANMAQNAGCETIIAQGIIERPVSSVLNNERRHTKCLAFGVATSPLKVWLSNRLQVAGTLIVSDAVAEMIVAGKRGLNREDVISIQGDFMKGDVLHIYSAVGKECARGLANFSSQEIMMLARNIEQTVEQVLGYMTKSAVISAENLLVLEDHHLPWDAPEDAPKLVTHS